MANEIRVTCSLQIKKGNINYQSRPTAFTADMQGDVGPAVGTILVPLAGVNVDLSQLGTPGLCRIQNLDTTNYVVIGIYDGSIFFPMLELLPGESYPLRLYREIGTEFTGTGTGTPADVNNLRIKAFGGPCLVLVEAFEK